MSDDTVTQALPVLRPEAPPDEVLTGPPWWLALVAWVDVRVERWRDRYPAKHRAGVARGTDAQVWSWLGPTGEWPVLGGVT